MGNFVIVWTSRFRTASDFGVFAQRFGGLLPAALAVDTPGNRVLEPGETVDVRPGWRNVNGAAQTFTGTLTDITGPAGRRRTRSPTAPPTTGRCADGASRAVHGLLRGLGRPTRRTRPALHWDASAVESILPDAQGQQKQWRLHVGRSFTDVPPPTLLPLRRDAAAPRRHRRLHARPSTARPASTTREQMAVFVLVAKEGAGYVPPACATPMFADVPASSPFCRWIEELARRGVVGGCGGGNYCPTSAVTREQMAVFVLRTLDPALNPPACTTPDLRDVPATQPVLPLDRGARRGAAWSPAAAAATTARRPPVTREQMGVFISVTFGLTLYGP